MRNVIKEMIAYLLLIGLTIFMLFTFSIIGRYGVAVHEPNTAILVFELVFCAGMLAFGIERLRNLVKRFRKRGE